MHYDDDQKTRDEDLPRDTIITECRETAEVIWNFLDAGMEVEIPYDINGVNQTLIIRATQESDIKSLTVTLRDPNGDFFFHRVDNGLIGVPQKPEDGIIDRVESFIEINQDAAYDEYLVILLGATISLFSEEE